VSENLESVDHAPEELEGTSEHDVQEEPTEEESFVVPNNVFPFLRLFIQDCWQLSRHIMLEGIISVNELPLTPALYNSFVKEFHHQLISAISGYLLVVSERHLHQNFSARLGQHFPTVY